MLTCGFFVGQSGTNDNTLYFCYLYETCEYCVNEYAVKENTNLWKQNSALSVMHLSHSLMNHQIDVQLHLLFVVVVVQLMIV